MNGGGYGGYGGGGSPGYIPDNGGGMYGRMAPGSYGGGGYGQPNRQYGGPMGMGMRTMGGDPSGMSDPTKSGAAPYSGFDTQPTAQGPNVAQPYTGFDTMPAGMQQRPPGPASDPFYNLSGEDQKSAMMNGTQPGGGGLLGNAPGPSGDPNQPIRQAPPMGLQNTPAMAPESRPQGQPAMGLQSMPQMPGAPGTPWLTRAQLDAQSGDVNYGVPNPGLGATPPAAAPPGQDAGQFYPGFQNGNSTLDPQSMAFLTHWMGGSNSPWGPTQQQQVDGYNNWYQQQYPTR